jgi:hypothetical protein
MLRRILPIVLLALLAAPAAAAAADTPPLRAIGDHRPFGDERLSNETTVTRWAHTNLLGAIQGGRQAALEHRGRRT